MTSAHVIIPADTTAAQPCPCGCAECTGGCCDLKCPVQPRFFWGQFLTDRDLTALVDWTGDRLSLGRFRHGWGVACGMDVLAHLVQGTNNSGPRTSWISVGPGYAVSCCGQDVVLCDEATLNLSGAFDRNKDGCAVPARPNPPSAPPASQEWSIGGLTYPSENVREVRVVDLYARRVERGWNAQPAAPGTATQTSRCEYTRVSEEAEVFWQCVGNPDSTATLDDEQATWNKHAASATKLLDEFVRSPQRPQWLRSRLTTHPLQRFRHAYPLYTTLVETIQRRQVQANPNVQIDPKDPSTYREEPVKQDDLNGEETQAVVMFMIIQELLGGLLATGGCAECSTTRGIPLARVWLGAFYDQNNRRTIDVLHIDTRAPYRRPLSSQRWANKPGNVRQWHVFGQPVETARAALAAAGIAVVSETSWPNPKDTNASIELLSRMLSGNKLNEVVGNKVRLHVLDVKEMGRWVVGVE